MILEQPSFWLRWMFPKAAWRMDKDERAVYLTFDDGPIPQVFRQIIDEGHQVGNHTFNHLGGLKHLAKTYLQNVEKANQLIDAHLFRPPYGWMRPSEYYILRKKYQIVMWDLVTRDYSKWMTATDVVNNVKRYTRNGSIITFHDSLKSIDKLKTALPASLEWLREQGYRFKTFE